MTCDDLSWWESFASLGEADSNGLLAPLQCSFGGADMLQRDYAAASGHFFELLFDTSPRPVPGLSYTSVKSRRRVVGKAAQRSEGR